MGNDEQYCGDGEDNDGQSPWCFLPDLIMEKIYAYLTIRERYYASMVCRRWNAAFYLPYVWYSFEFEESTLTRRRFNYYSGWQHTLDHLRAQLCLATVGRHFRVLIFSPMTNFYNMYEFMNMLSYYAEQQDFEKFPNSIKGIGKNIRTLRYTFPCKILSGDDESQAHGTQELHIYGTGGKLLAAVKRLMNCLTNLRRLELIDLMLANSEAQTLLDDVCCNCCTTLRFLSLINITKGQSQLLHVGVFLNLQVLVLSPQNLGKDVVEMLGYTRLIHLHLVQTRLTPVYAKSVEPKAWLAATKINPNLNVHLTLHSKLERALVWQEQAPVSTIFFDSPYSKLGADILTRATMWYRERLKVFGHSGLPKYRQPKSFSERIDPFLLMLVKDCPNIQILMVRERISTMTVLLIAEHGKSLERFYVRKNAVILRCDWPKNPVWDTSYYNWLKRTSRSYDLTEIEVSKILGQQWKMLSDKAFKDINPVLY